jgi:hypothetical protein
MGSPVGSLVHYTRTGGRLPPRDRERLTIFADGSFEMWRSVGAASQPPSPVGRFQGRVPGELFKTLEQQAAGAGTAGDLAVMPPPDAAIDRIQVAGAQASMGRHDQPAGPWGSLAETLRAALGVLTSQPAAALALQVSPSGTAARLVHQGSQRLRVDLRHLQVRAVLWNQRKKEGDWRQQTSEAEIVEAGPGWSFDLLFAHGFTVAPGLAVAAYVTAGLFDGEQLVPVSLEARSQA